MEKIYVKLKDRGSVVYDASQNITIVGTKPYLVEKTALITKALTSVLVLMTLEDATAELESYEVLKKAALKGEAEAIAAKAIKKAGKLNVINLQTNDTAEKALADIVVNEHEAELGKAAETDKKPLVEDIAPKEGAEEPLVDGELLNLPALVDAPEVKKEEPAVVDIISEIPAVPANEVKQVGEVLDTKDEPKVALDYMSWTNDKLGDELKLRAINYSGITKKVELATLLQMDDEKKK